MHCLHGLSLETSNAVFFKKILLLVLVNNMLVTEIRCKKQSNETWRALITKFPEITIHSYVLFLIPTPKKFKSVMDFFYRKVTGYKAVNLSKKNSI